MDGSHAEIWWYAAEWAIRLVALAVVPMRRAPVATTSWLLLIFFLPVPGLILYLLIGRPRFPRWRAERRQALRPFHDEIAARLALTSPPATETSALALRLGRFPPTSGDRVELADDYDAVIARLCADIDAARHHVHLLAYIVADDAVGQQVADALGRAVGRGVRCRVMFDPVGSHRWRRGTLRMLARAGVEVREALPFRWLRDRTRRDMRNHRKLFLIDGRIGYIGSQNIVAKDFRPGVTNRELVARVEGPAIAAMQAVVEGDWRLEGAEPPDPVPVPVAAGEAATQLLPTGADFAYQGFETLLVWQLHRAERHAVLVTPYLIPDEEVLGAMRTAALRGVCVDVVVSKVVDQPFVHLAQCSYYAELMAAGVRINEYPDYLLHAKNVRIDDALGIVGSSNVDIRSFQLNEEAVLLLYDGGSIAALDRVQRGYLARCTTIDPDAWAKRGLPRQVAENIARLVSPLL